MAGEMEGFAQIAACSLVPKVGPARVHCLLALPMAAGCKRQHLTQACRLARSPIRFSHRLTVHGSLEAAEQPDRKAILHLLGAIPHRSRSPCLIASTQIIQPSGN